MSTNYRCIDCKLASPTQVCSTCLAARAKCPTDGCTVRLNPNAGFSHCKNCTCSTANCKQPRMGGAKWCSDHNLCKQCKIAKRPTIDDPFCLACKESWAQENPRCKVCCKNKHKKSMPCEINTYMCMGCTNLAAVCKNGCKNKIWVDEDGVKYDYCSHCICKNCTNAATKDSKYCKTCIDRFQLCGKVGSIGPCRRLKDHAQEFQCGRCCKSPKCTRPRNSYQELCSQCAWRRSQYPTQLICRGSTCFEYTANNTGYCSKSACVQEARQHHVSITILPLSAETKEQTMEEKKTYKRVVVTTTTKESSQQPLDDATNAKKQELPPQLPPQPQTTISKEAEQQMQAKPLIAIPKPAPPPPSITGAAAIATSGTFAPETVGVLPESMPLATSIMNAVFTPTPIQMPVPKPIVKPSSSRPPTPPPTSSSIPEVPRVSLPPQAPVQQPIQEQAPPAVQQQASPKPTSGKKIQHFWTWDASSEQKTCYDLSSQSHSLSSQVLFVQPGTQSLTVQRPSGGPCHVLVVFQ